MIFSRFWIFFVFFPRFSSLLNRYTTLGTKKYRWIENRDYRNYRNYKNHRSYRNYRNYKSYRSYRNYKNYRKSIGGATKKVQLFLYSLNDGFRMFDAQTDKRSTKKVQLFLYSLNDGFLRYSLLEGYYWIRMIFICTF